MASLPRQQLSIHERIAKIEKQNRYLRNSIAVLAFTFLGLLLMGATAALQDGKFRQITAEKITIVDSAGHELIQLGTNNERTGIRMFNKAGKKVLGIGLANEEGEGGFLISDKEGRPRIGAGMDGDVPGIALVNKQGKKILALGGDERGYGLVVLDENEVQRASIGYKAEYTGVILLDDKGQYVRGMVRDANGSDYFSHVDKNGEEIIDK